MGFSKWIVSTFATPAGIFVLAVLDSTLFFSLPFGIDAAVILLAARGDDMVWLAPCLATAGSLTGGAFTFWLGAKVGEAGLERFVPAARLKAVQQRVRRTGAIALASLNVIPPPFPFTPFLLAAGALHVRRVPFFTTFVAMRLLRFGLEAYLASRLGQRIVGWLDSPVLQYIVMALVVAAVTLTALALVKFFRSTGRAVAARPTS